MMLWSSIRHNSSSNSSRLTTLSFGDICPTWSNKLKADLDNDDLHILIRKPEMCIVGEAWGYSSRYIGYKVVYLIPFIGCLRCIKFGNKIGKAAKQHNGLCKSYLRPIINDFVNHWNEKHQEITLKKKENLQKMT